MLKTKCEIYHVTYFLEFIIQLTESLIILLKEQMTIYKYWCLSICILCLMCECCVYLIVTEPTNYITSKTVIITGELCSTYLPGNTEKAANIKPSILKTFGHFCMF